MEKLLTTLMIGMELWVVSFLTGLFHPKSNFDLNPEISIHLLYLKLIFTLGMGRVLIAVSEPRTGSIARHQLFPHGLVEQDLADEILFLQRGVLGLRVQGENQGEDVSAAVFPAGGDPPPVVVDDEKTAHQVDSEFLGVAAAHEKG